MMRLRLIYTCTRKTKIGKYTVDPGERFSLISMTSDEVTLSPVDKENIVKFVVEMNDFSEAFRLEVPEK